MKAISRRKEVQYNPAMLILLLLPIVVSVLCLGAHMLRHFGIAGPIPAILLLVIMLIPRRWSAIVLQVALVLSVAEWVRTAAPCTRVSIPNIFLTFLLPSGRWLGIVPPFGGAGCRYW